MKAFKNVNNKPLITIGIPTYNRARYLKNNLTNIYEQIKDNTDFEVLVINNASTDDTEEVVMAFKKQYHNLRYIRNEKNIGADANIYKVMEEAEGIYCMLHRDDDYFVPGGLQEIKEIINQYRQCAIIFINNIKRSGEVIIGEGMDTFLNKVGQTVTGISYIIFKKEAFNSIKNPKQFLNTAINHMYIVFSILKDNPLYVLINKPYLVMSGARGESYNWGKFMIKDYLDILYAFEGNGLNSDTIKLEKRQLADKIVYWYKKLQQPRWQIDTGETIKYFQEYYKDESYYEAYYKQLIDIKKV